MKRSFWPAVTAATLTAATAAASLTAGPAAFAGTALSAAPLVTRAAAPVSARTAILINGDQLVVTSAGGPEHGLVVPPPGGGLADPLMTISLGGQAYEIPAAALPYLGRGLDPSLFDVTALLRQETDRRIPLRIGYAGRPPALPGVTVTSSGGGIARGYLTASSARAFGAALARQFAADQARSSYGTDGMFAGGVSVSLPGAAPPPAVRPDQALDTLTVTASNLAGQPDNGGTVTVINVDNNALNTNLQQLQKVFANGSATFSEPAGHYCAVATFFEWTGNKITGMRAVILPQFTVSGDTSVHVAERSASSEVTAVTPHKAVTNFVTLTLLRLAATGVSPAAPPVSWAWTVFTQPLWVTPTTRRPSAGTLQTVTDETLTSPAGAPGTPWEYDLAYQSSGIIPPQRHVVQPSGLAVVDQNDYLDTTADGYMYREAETQVQTQTPQFSNPVTLALPGQRVDYTSAGPGLAWTSTLVQDPEGVTGGTLQFSGEQIYWPGERVNEDLNAYPLHPGAFTDPIGAAYIGYQAVSAARSGNTVTLMLTPFTDNTPGDVGTGFGTGFGAPVTGTYQIDDNGAQVAAGDATTALVWQATVAQSPSVIRFVLDAAEPASALSSRTRTVWTWPSSPPAARALPPQWFCPSSYLDGFSTDCTAQPLLTLEYSVAGMGLDGSVRPGRQALGLTVGHLQLAKAAPVTGATVQVSLNDGATWQEAAVTGGWGRYQAAFTVPAPAGGNASYVTLRVTARDAAGGEITETIWRAYEVTP
jgi:hypothetical protein